MSRIQLNLNGRAYSGWQSVTVNRSLEAVAGRFDLTVTDNKPFPVPRGGEVELLIYGKPVIKGYTDMLEVETASDVNSLRIAGRDKTGDLVDASALVDSQELNNVTLKEIIEEILEPFGIPATLEIAPQEIFKKFSFQEETAYEAIERACRLRGVFASSDRKGGLIIREYGKARAPVSLEMGVNVLSARAQFDDRERFSDYYVYGQQAGDDNTTPKASARPEGQASDNGVERYRPMIIVAEGNVDSAIAQERAEWEATVRAARASTVEIMVQGWETTEGGSLWEENALVKTILPFQRINGDMLIKELTYSLDNNQGEKTRLVLTRPDAYKKEVELTKEKAGHEDE